MCADVLGASCGSSWKENVPLEVWTVMIPAPPPDVVLLVPAGVVPPEGVVALGVEGVEAQPARTRASATRRMGRIGRRPSAPGKTLPLLTAPRRRAPPRRGACGRPPSRSA